MTDWRSHARLWRGPLGVWVALLALFAVTLALAYQPFGDNAPVNLLIAAVMVAVLLFFLMDLRHAKVVVRIVAGAGLFWLILMFALTFNDYLSRHY